MTGLDWRALGLQARIAAGRLSPVWVLAVLCLALGAVTWLGGAGRQEATLEALRQALTQRHAQLRAPVAKFGDIARGDIRAYKLFCQVWL